MRDPRVGKEGLVLPCEMDQGQMVDIRKVIVIIWHIEHYLALLSL